MESEGDQEALPASASSTPVNDHDAASQSELLPLQYISIAAGAAIVLPLLYRLGPASSLLIIVFAVYVLLYVSSCERPDLFGRAQRHLRRP